MPATPDKTETLEQLDFEPPRLPDVPARESEKNLQQQLNVEDRRRKEALLEELRKQLEGTSVGEMATRFVRSPSARKRQIAVRGELERLQKLTFRRGDRWEGPCSPFTVVNFNPVLLTLQGQLNRWSVPAAGTMSGHEDLDLTWRGRKFPLSYITFRTPDIWLAPIATQSDIMLGVDTAVMRASHIPPAGIAHQFYSHYSEGSADAEGMGGILFFEGDIHTLNKKTLARNNNMLWVPKQEITLDGLGDWVYTVEEKPLEKLMERALLQQRNYAEITIAEGHRFATSQSDIERNQLREYHRRWHNWALDRGYLEAAYPWASERLKDSPTTQAVYCPDCRTRQTDPEQFFCSNCNAPFDALNAFLAGKVVSHDRLAIYEGKDWEAIEKEFKRRQKKLAFLSTPEAKNDKPGEAKT